MVTRCQLSWTGLLRRIESTWRYITRKCKSWFYRKTEEKYEKPSIRLKILMLRRFKMLLTDLGVGMKFFLKLKPRRKRKHSLEVPDGSVEDGVTEPLKKKKPKKVKPDKEMKINCIQRKS
jgi:hypothetical protein